MQTAWLTDLFHERQLSTTRLSLTGAFSTTLTCKTPLATSQHQLDGNRGVTLSSHPSGAPPAYQGCSIAVSAVLAQLWYQKSFPANLPNPPPELLCIHIYISIYILTNTLPSVELHLHQRNLWAHLSAKVWDFLVLPDGIQISPKDIGKIRTEQTEGIWVRWIVVRDGRESIVTASRGVLISCNSNLFELYVQYMHSQAGRYFKASPVSGTSSVPQRSYLLSGLHKNSREKLPPFRHSVVRKEPLALPHVSTGQSQSQTSLGLNPDHFIFLCGPVPKLLISLHQHKLSWKHGAGWIRKQAVFLATFCNSLSTLPTEKCQKTWYDNRQKNSSSAFS